MYETFVKAFKEFNYKVNKPDGWCPITTVCTVEGSTKELTSLVRTMFETEGYNLYIENEKFIWGFSNLESYGRHRNRLQIIGR